MRYTVIYHNDPDGWWAEVPDLPGCFSAGNTRDDAERNVREAIVLHVETALAEGVRLPEPTHEAGIIDIPE